MTSVRFTFDAQDLNVQSLLRQIQAALQQVRVDEAGAADAFSRITAGARQALAVAQAQAATAKEQLRLTIQQGAESVAAAKQAVALARQQAAEVTNANRTMLAQTRELGAAQEAAARAQLATAQQELAARREAIALARQERNELALASRQQVLAATANLNQTLDSLRNAETTLRELQLHQTRLGLQGAPTAESEAAISQQSAIVASLEAENSARQAALKTASDELKVATQNAKAKENAENAVVQSVLREAQARRALALQEAGESKANLVAGQEALASLRQAQADTAASPASLAANKELIANHRELIAALKEEADAQQVVLRDARLTAQQQKIAADETILAEQRAVLAAQQEVAAQAELVAASETATATAVAGAEARAEASATAARAAIAEAEAAVAAARETAAANTATAASQLAQARTSQIQATQTAGVVRAQGQLARSHQQAAAAATGQASATSSLTRQLVEFFAALEGARLFARFIAEGLKFDQTIETAVLSIGSLIDAESDIRLDDRPVRDFEKLAVSVAQARHQVDLLRVAGLQTAATTEQLVNAFQQAVGPGIAAGLTLDQIRKVTVQIVQASGALGVPLNQLNQEVRSILDATIDRNSRVARVLGITNEQVRLAKEENTLADFLNQKLEAFTQAGTEAAKTWFVIKSNMLEALQVFAGDATKPLFTALEDGFTNALAAAFDFKNARISTSLQGFIGAFNVVFAKVGEGLQAAIQKSVEGAQDLSKWFDENRTEIDLTVGAVDDVFDAIGHVLAEAIKLGAEIVNWAVHSNDFRAVLSGVADVLNAIVGTVDFLVNNGFGRALAAATALYLIIRNILKATAALAAATAAGGAAAGAGGLLGALKFLTTPIGLVIAALGVLLVLYERFKAKQEELIAQQEAVAEAFRHSEQAITDTATAYAKLADQIDKGKLTGDELVQAQAKLLDLSTQLSSVDPQFASVLRDRSVALQQQIDEENALKAAHQQTQLTIDKLQGELNSNTLSVKQASLVREQLRQETLKLTQQEKDYTKVVTDQKGTYKTILLQLVDISQARLNDVQAQFLQATAALALIKAQQAQAAAAAKAAVESGPITSRAREADVLGKIKTESDLGKGVTAVQKIVDDLTLKLALARTAFNNLKDAVASPNIDIIGRPRPDDKDTAAKLQNDAKQFAQANISQIKSLLDLTTEMLNESLRDHEISISDFNERIVKAQTDAVNAQIKQHQILISKLTDKGDIAIQLADIKNLENSKTDIVINGEKQMAQQVKALDKELSDARIEALTASGQTEQAEVEKVRQRFADLRAAVAAELTGPSPKATPADLAMVDSLLNMEIFKVRIQAVRDMIQQLTTDVGEQISEIQDKMQLGTILPTQGAKDAIAVYEQGIVDLEGLKANYQALADATGDPAAFKAVTLLERAILGLNVQLRNAKDAAAELTKSLFDALSSSLANFLSQGVDTAKGVGDAFRQLALDVVNAIRQIMAQLLAFQISSFIFKAIGVTVPGGTKGAAGSHTGGLIAPPGVPTAPGFSTGGFIMGPASSARDNLNIRVEPWEYVIRAQKVREYGVEFFDDINFGRSMPTKRRKRAYHDGGLVADAQTMMHDVDRLLGKIVVSPDEGAIVRVMQSRQGRRVQIETLQQQPRAANRALSRSK